MVALGVIITLASILGSCRSGRASISCQFQIWLNSLSCHKFIKSAEKPDGCIFYHQIVGLRNDDLIFRSTYLYGTYLLNYESAFLHSARII